MATRDYILIDVPVAKRLWPDRDLIVAVTEYVRLNLLSLEPLVPGECEFDLIASRTSHNPSPIPLLGLYAPPDMSGRVPDWPRLDEVVETWCAGKTDDELRAIGRVTVAPTWEELLASRIYPARDGSS